MHKPDLEGKFLLALNQEKVQEEKRVNRLEVAQQRAKDQKKDDVPIYIPEREIQQALKDKTAYQAKHKEITQLEELLLSQEDVYENLKHPRLEAQRQKIEKAKEALRGIEKKLRTVIRKELIELHEVMNVDSGETIKID